jgi:carbonic anhydrase
VPLLAKLFKNNSRWAEESLAADPEFFTRLVSLQAPNYLWIGCADSRVPANQITGLDPGEVFVHRNVANIVVHTDLNCLSVLQYAVEVLRVSHVIVCGHYGCGGVRAALEGRSLGLIDNWLRHIRDVAEQYGELLAALPDGNTQWRALCELNVIRQAYNVAGTPIIREAWKRDQTVAVHGWVYCLSDGRLVNLDVSMSANTSPEAAAAKAVEALRVRYGLE